MNPSIITESISSLQVSDVQNLKGGEKTTSEWEELEKLSKDELIIELVKSRRAMRNVCRMLQVISEDGAAHFFYDVGEKPSKEWLDKIAAYAKVRCDPGDGLDRSDLEIYGIDGETAETYCYGSYGGH